MVKKLLRKIFKRKPKVVTRFAPSPTGLLHAGNYRTGVFSYLFAKQNNGKFVLRIEDTDKARSKKEFEQNILESLKWLGLPYDEIYHQSERSSIYKEYLHKIVDSGAAYISKETPKEVGDRTEVIRFKNPNKKVKFHDLIRGEIEFDTTELNDFIIAKSFDEPVFHFAVVLDDFLMGITHVIRGEDHISNTPRQILIQEALGAPTPLYAHLPLVLAPDRSKLSKRKGALAMTEYRDKGYLPEALLNYMTLLGWNPGTEREIFTLKELIKEFKLDKVQKGGAIFDETKLRFINKGHLKNLSHGEKVKVLKMRILNSNKAVVEKWHIDDKMLSRIVDNVFERIDTFGDINVMIQGGDFDFYFKTPDYKKESLLWKDGKDFSVVRRHLVHIHGLLSKMPDWVGEDVVKALIWPYAESSGRGEVLWPLRFSLSGKEKSPNPFALICALGKAETLKRIDNAIAKIS